MFSFAKSQRYLPADWNEMESIPLWKMKDEQIEIFTPEEMTLLLAQDNIVPFLAIGAFAGLRSAEFERLDWATSRFGSGLGTGRQVGGLVPERMNSPRGPCFREAALCHFAVSKGAFGDRGRTLVS